MFEVGGLEMARIMALNESHIRLIVESMRLSSFARLFQIGSCCHGKSKDRP